MAESVSVTEPAELITTELLVILYYIYWRKRRLIGKLYMDQSVKPKLDQGQKRSMKIGRGVKQGCCLSPILFNLYSEYLTKEPFEVFRGFKIGRQVNRNVKYADDIVLLAEE
jgi:hypothetical protein